jgi:hypothetical protein
MVFGFRLAQSLSLSLRGRINVRNIESHRKEFLDSRIVELPRSASGRRAAGYL